MKPTFFLDMFHHLQKHQKTQADQEPQPEMDPNDFPYRVVDEAQQLEHHGKES